jgi:hypothetical protein
MAASVTQSIFDVFGAGSQFMAMLLGAFLASAGGFFVAWLLDRMQRKRQERSIALVCLDLLASLSVIANLAKGARGRGDPYGPLTLRFVRNCMRDLDVYERNRERIADISDPALRAEIYQCMARYTLAVDGILSESELIAKLDETIEAARERGDAAKVQELTKAREERWGRRDASFDFMMETVASGEPLAARLRGLAKADAFRVSEIVARNAPPPPPESPG